MQLYNYIITLHINNIRHAHLLFMGSVPRINCLLIRGTFTIKANLYKSLKEKI